MDREGSGIESCIRVRPKFADYSSHEGEILYINK